MQPPNRPEGDPHDDPYDAYTGPEFLPSPLGPPLHNGGRPEAEPPRRGAEPEECDACRAPDEEYVWVSERWRVRATRRPTAIPVVLGLETRPHLDLGDLPNLLAAELGVMTVRLEKALRSLPGVAQVHVNRWGDGESHLRVWFLTRPARELTLRGPYLPVWDHALPRGDEAAWRQRLGLVAAWLGEFGGRVVVDPPRIAWSRLGEP